MLVLTRRVGESLNLYEKDLEIEILICSVRGSHVKIGIKAPKNVKILRSELSIDVKN